MHYTTDMPVPWLMDWLDYDDDRALPLDLAQMQRIWNDETDALMLALGADFGMSEHDGYTEAVPITTSLFAYAQQWDAAARRQRRQRHARVRGTIRRARATSIRFWPVAPAS